MLLKQLFDQATWTYSYLLADTDTGEAVMIDPVLEQVDRDLKLIHELGLNLVYVLDTHVHADHVTGAGQLRRLTGALSGVAGVADVACADRSLVHGDMVRFGQYGLEVRSTPGHTNGCLTYVVQADGKTYAFTGDALFIRGCGRTDFQQGDAATLYRSVHQQIYTLPNDTVIYPGHDYRGHRESTVAEELAHNPRLNQGVSEAKFVHTMDNLNLAHPKRIHEALPANMGCGLMDDESEIARAQETRESTPFKSIEPKSLRLSTGIKLVDVRRAEEFDGELGHLPGAILAPLGDLASSAQDWPRQEPLVLVCRSGMRSAHGCELLADMGFTDVTNLTGGMTAWHEQIGG